ncbi:cyclic nucleotide-gated cation channel alpha-3-like [Uloborus diversus]|uniref:cyclic nucleotide-gated cation channel alpha-3-like n=1 Tax=Uloborus diversus TaxID=327109 RepID=UPI0024090A16|nr:cyclic nucleotide-gated cation channel alpha-3-like [Uloborus diversus]
MSTTLNNAHNGPNSDANNNSSTGGANSTTSTSSQAKSSRLLLQNSEQEVRHFPRFIFDPDSGLIFYWTAVVALATLYNAWTTALRIAFPEIREENGLFYLTYLDVASDITYLLDILMQLRTAYLQDGIPVFETWKIRQHYMSQTHFIQDVISAIPSQTLIGFLPDVVGYCKYFLCTAGAARLTRLLKFHILYKFYDLAESFTSNPHLIRVLRLFLNLAVIIHWIACLYYLLSEYEGLGSNAWVYTNATDQQRFSRKYIVCLYWSAMTLTTIGNTNSPETDMEYIFTGLTFMTGVFVFATVMGNVGDVISSMNANRQEFQARMDHIQMYLTHKKVPASLQLKIKKWAEYTWSRTKATDESRLLNMLPERLRAEVAVHVHLDSLKKVKIFEQCETGFLCELVLKLRSQVFSPGDYVCRAGETGREMFIINHGKVEVLVPSPATNKDMVVAVLSEGNYFGEISLLRLDGVQNRRTADVRSIGYSELLCLSRRDLMTALVEYPEAKSVLEVQAKKRMKTNLQAQRAFSVDTLLRSSQDSSVDSGIHAKDELRGHDVSEIKAMIEELKNANKVPGRTIWQLIARCEVLQAKLCDKEREVEDSKYRIRELEQLLGTCHLAKHDKEQSASSESSADSLIQDSQPCKLLRPSNKVTKQYSQDEGRAGVQSTTRVIPDVKITKPASEAFPSTDDGAYVERKSVFADDNFIKTSKITNVTFDKTVNFRHQTSNTSFDSDDTKSFEETSSMPDRYRFTDLDPQTSPKALTKANPTNKNGFRVFSQNVFNMPTDLDGYFSNAVSVDQEIFLNGSDGISFTSHFKDHVYFADALDLNVETIPEENEEDDQDMSDLNSSTEFSKSADMPSDGEGNFVESKDGSAEKNILQSTDVPLCEVPNYVATVGSLRKRYSCPEAEQSVPRSATSQSPADKSVSQCRKQRLDDFTLDALDSDTGIKFLRLNSLASCFSDDTCSRRNSWNWDSEYDSEEDETSS